MGWNSGVCVSRKSFYGVREDRGKCTVLHLKSHFLISSPPPSEPRLITPLSLYHLPVAFMHKQAPNSSRSRIQILIVTPHRKIYVPVVQTKLHVPSCVCEIPAHDDSVGVCVRSYGGDVEELARVVLDSWEENKGCGGCMQSYRFEDL